MYIFSTICSKKPVQIVILRNTYSCAYDTMLRLTSYYYSKHLYIGNSESNLHIYDYN
ncbi:unnamed protein product [Arabidopsis halleri]